MTVKAQVKAQARGPLSLQLRVMLFVGVTISLSMFLIGHLVLKAVERHFAEQDAGELKAITHAVEVRLQGAIERGLDVNRALGDAIAGYHGASFVVWDAQGHVYQKAEGAGLAQHISHFAAVARIRPDTLYYWHADGKMYRGTIVMRQVGGVDYRIASAIDMDFHMEFLDSFNRSLWAIMLVAGALTLLAAWYGVHQGHAPLRGLSDTMRDIQADRLHVRLDPALVPTELKPLVASFNHMLSRLEDSFQRLSHFSADIAHELRTPLTNLITQTQVGLSKSRSLDEYRELLYSNLEEQERLTKMVNDMLWLAQSDHGLIRLESDSLELMREARATVEFFDALAEERGISLRVSGNPVVVRGDRAMLRRVISNLLSNAMRYTGSGGEVKIEVGESGQWACLSVENPGNIIAAEHLPNLFDRFYRVDPSRKRDSAGAGLGLAIVRSIVEAHGGNISVLSEAGITRFTVTLPLH